MGLFTATASNATSLSCQKGIDPPKNDLIVIFQHGKVIKVEGESNEKSVRTTGEETLQIAGSNNIIYAKGGLKSLIINGMNNEIYVDRINNVKIEGGNNLVSYKMTADLSGKPRVVSKGYNNDIVKTK
ncbi:DUF3060 domain-containing protein [Sphingobacterium sp. LRF_L2]|uniref:DUF3060 domain-containing protein n=1 Tax=Sphingobacterium sp. LRF_L2 TaxID=3369421 RepID=UPI003F6353B7